MDEMPPTPRHAADFPPFANVSVFFRTLSPTPAADLFVCTPGHDSVWTSNFLCRAVDPA